MRAIILFLALTTGAAAQTAAPIPSPYTQGSDAANTVGQLAYDVMNCARVPQPAPTAVKSVTGPTIVTAHFSHGAATAVEVTTPSGNPDLDKRVVDCVKNAPTNLASALVDGQKIIVPVFWPRPAPTNTITVQSRVGPPPPNVGTRSVPGITAPVSIGARHVCDPSLYPRLAVLFGKQGTTRVRLTVSPQGAVTNVEVVNSSGSDMLDEASVACAQQWTYRPAMQNGVPVQAMIQANIIWSLSGWTPPARPAVPPKSGPPGWFVGVNTDPAVVAVFYTPAEQPGFNQSMNVVVKGHYDSLEAYASQIRAIQQRHADPNTYSETPTTVCAGEPAVEMTYTRSGLVKSKPDLVLDFDEIITAKNGFAYEVTYARPLGDPLRLDAENWIHSYCQRVI
ncbi:MAG: energy transducer TonB [Rhizomicrobium sp.]